MASSGESPQGPGQGLFPVLLSFGLYGPISVDSVLKLHLRLELESTLETRESHVREGN